ncbi:DExH-box ATP-dependent RNA helicase DExH12-like protein [Tanacetum coccineum]
MYVLTIARTYNEQSTMSDIELCRLSSQSEKFKYVTVRQNEKMEHAKLLDRVPIPIKEEGLEEPSAKINVLLQAYISQLKLEEGLSLTSDMVFITQSAGRLMFCMNVHIDEIGVEKDWAYGRIGTEFREIVLLCPTELGRNLHMCIHQFPKLNLAAHVQPITRTILRVELTITPNFQWEDKIHGYVEPFWVLVEDNEVPDRWMGLLSVLRILFDHFCYLTRKVTPPPTECCWNLQTASRDCFSGNPRVLYNTDDNVLVAAPSRSGKTICAEFAILRNHQKDDESVMRAVYIAPVEALANERYNEWKKKFGDGVGT